MDFASESLHFPGLLGVVGLLRGRWLERQRDDDPWWRGISRDAIQGISRDAIRLQPLQSPRQAVCTFGCVRPTATSPWLA